MTQARATALPLRLADSLFESPLLTIPKAQSILGVTYRAAQLNVDKLVQAGVLRRLGESSFDVLRQLAEYSYPKMFIADEVLSAIWVSVA